MITHLNGKLVEKNPSYAIIECGGLGYFVNISIHTFSQLPDKETIKLYTQLIVREDAHILYGFYTKEERQMFNLLISVNGVGVASGRMILSTLSPVEVSAAINHENSDALKAVKGIGAKTAQRIILDLKDKINQIEIHQQENNLSIPENYGNKQEALSALEVLGFNKKSAEKTLELLVKENPNYSVEDLVKLAIQKL